MPRFLTRTSLGTVLFQAYVVQGKLRPGYRSLLTLDLLLGYVLVRCVTAIHVVIPD